MIPAGIGQIGIGALAGPGMDHDGVVGAGNAQVIGPQGPDGTKGVSPSRPEKMAIIRVTPPSARTSYMISAWLVPHWGHGHLDVVDHDRIGAAPIVQGAQSFPSQGIDMNDRLLGLSRHGLWRRRRLDVTGWFRIRGCGILCDGGPWRNPSRGADRPNWQQAVFFMIHTPQVFRKMGPAGTSLLPLYPVHEKSQCSRRNSPGQQHLLF